MPEPPTLDPLDLDLVTATFSSTGGHHIECAAGAAEPGSVLWAMNLDDAMPPTTTTVAADGSCAFDLPSFPGNQARLQLRDGARRSTPLDVLLPDATPVVPAIECLTIDPPLEADLGTVALGGESEAVITLRNGCATDVMLDGVRLRAPAASLTPVATTPAVLSTGGTAVVRARFTPAVAGLVEEALFLDLTSSFPDRRAIVVWGTGF